jgi:hypothetical protein
MKLPFFHAPSRIEFFDDYIAVHQLQPNLLLQKIQEHYHLKDREEKKNIKMIIIILITVLRTSKRTTQNPWRKKISCERLGNLYV